MTPFTLTNFMYDGVPLDLTGKRDEEDCWLERVCVAGTSHDLFDMLADGAIKRLAELADAQAAREAKKAESIDRTEANHARAMADPSRYWLTH